VPVRLIVGVGVAEQRTKPRQEVRRGADKTVEVVVPDLVAQVPQQGAVGLVHRDPELLAVHIVALGQIQCDHAVVVAGDDRLQLAGQQVERQAVLRVVVAANDRPLQVNEFDHQPPLGLLGRGERGQRCGVGVVGAGAGQAARRAQLGSSAQPGVHGDQPIAFGHMEIGTQMILVGVDDAAALPHDKHTEFSNARCCPQLGQWKSRMGHSQFERRLLHRGHDQALPTQFSSERSGAAGGEPQPRWRGAGVSGRRSMVLVFLAVGGPGCFGCL
jgi:hypothetical protein